LSILGREGALSSRFGVVVSRRGVRGSSNCGRSFTGVRSRTSGRVVRDGVSGEPTPSRLAGFLPSSVAGRRVSRALPGWVVRPEPGWYVCRSSLGTNDPVSGLSIPGERSFLRGTLVEPVVRGP